MPGVFWVVFSFLGEFFRVFLLGVCMGVGCPLILLSVIRFCVVFCCMAFAVPLVLPRDTLWEASMHQDNYKKGGEWHVCLAMLFTKHSHHCTAADLFCLY